METKDSGLPPSDMQDASRTSNLIIESDEVEEGTIKQNDEPRSLPIVEDVDKVVENIQKDDKFESIIPNDLEDEEESIEKVDSVANYTEDISTYPMMEDNEEPITPKSPSPYLQMFFDMMKVVHEDNPEEPVNLIDECDDEDQSNGKSDSKVQNTLHNKSTIPTMQDVVDPVALNSPNQYVKRVVDTLMPDCEDETNISKKPVHSSNEVDGGEQVNQRTHIHIENHEVLLADAPIVMTSTLFPTNTSVTEPKDHVINDDQDCDLKTALLNNNSNSLSVTSLYPNDGNYKLELPVTLPFPNLFHPDVIKLDHPPILLRNNRHLCDYCSKGPNAPRKGNKRLQTSFQCLKCRKYLCLTATNNCFVAYHQHIIK